MRYDLKFNYDFLIYKIVEKYKDTTLNKSLDSFCREVKYFTLSHMKRIMNNRCYFGNNEMVKISKVLSLSSEEIIKCFLILDNK